VGEPAIYDTKTELKFNDRPGCNTANFDLGSR
jgi:hypothetical protein